MKASSPAKPDAVKKIKRLVNQLNNHWLHKRIDKLADFFDEKVVMTESGTNRRFVGRKAMIESYRQFIEAAEVSDFKITSMVVDVFGTTASVLYTFRIHYRYETTYFDESGTEILVFHRKNNRWLIVWRRQEPTGE